ncbi:MAG: restriction endonuclease [Lentisphaerae bacterium]|nr:restriction endonuclease [Lentisphaerota bacterium]
MTPNVNEQQLFYGDNLKILRDYIASESVDLIYLDPPFNSNRSYNVLFKEESGQESESQLTAFEDTWHWDMTAESTYHELITGTIPEVSTMIGALREFIGTNQMMAYLVMMTARLLELHRVLKSTGSLYLHCDPTASHYLKIALDTIFGVENFRNEFVWKRSSAHSDTKQGAKQAGRIHDVIFFYTKSQTWTWNPIYTEYDDNYVQQNYRYIDPINGRKFRVDNLTAAKPGGDTSYEWRVKRKMSGITGWEADVTQEYTTPKDGWEYKGIPPYKKRFWAYSQENMREFARQDRLYYSESGMPNYKRYLDEMPGVPLQDLWTDISPISAQAAERLGYPTQKPVALLERIVQASSHEGDCVLDPFCGCGTTIHAAQKLNRHWIGIDITHLAIALQKYRLKDAFNLVEGSDYHVIGEPESLSSAKQLAQDDRYQFQWWALSLIQAQPVGGEAGSKKGKKGKDRGIDGMITFLDDARAKPKRLIVQVKSGKVKSGDIRDLVGTIERENAPIGVFITLESPSKDMKKEAASAGFYHSPNWNKDYPRIQILTVEELLAGATVQMPPTANTYKKAQRERQQQGEQQQLL